MSVTKDGLSYWQAENEGYELLDTTIGDLLDHCTAELRDYCKGRISHQKIPRYFRFVDSFPLTGSGKVQKFVLREQAIKELGLEDVASIKTA